MKNTVLGTRQVLVLLALPVGAQTVYVDYDRAVDFPTAKGFAWARTPETSVRDSSPLMDSRIKSSIEYQLTEIGTVEDTESPDVFVTYHTDENNEMRLDTTSFGCGMGPFWGWDPYWRRGGMVSSTTTEQNYIRGTLVIDLWTADSKQLIWRGSAEAVVPKNPDKQVRLIEKAVKKIMNKWGTMYSFEA